ncbi:helix-turn-helix transcriptional regulator [Paenibacillus sp. MMS18-CY102]|uniref:helix-turn-helix transcriptional regulator n=1 Tax=Paenibacillus sp. MMS18-CY102 TaxID=2682849 RepID=UPI001366473E|nr:AraC family transcriptional regulator [Paenibacillus sp. MMS18-CY102]MWC30715.1 helix-turn-helix domain-containing protein [Paenibacillus sp. MMS18-CY102]
MELITLGQRYFPGLCHAMCCGTELVQMGPHGVKTRYQIILVSQGTGLVQVNGRAYPLTSPAIYCVDESSTIEMDECAALRVKAVYFHPGVINHRFTFDRLSQPDALEGSDYDDLWCLKPFREHADGYYGCIPLDTATARHLSIMMDQMADMLEMQPDNQWPCRSRSYLMELLFLLSRICKQAIAPSELSMPSVDASLQPIISHLHTYYRDKIKLEHLTAQFHTNKTTLNHRFRACTGQSVMAYLGGIRMQIAASLLRNTLLPTEEIVSRIGLSDDAHFIRSFRNYAGCTPAEYRHLHCWMLERA